jgi:hypothetical protein
MSVAGVVLGLHEDLALLTGCAQGLEGARRPGQVDCGRDQQVGAGDPGRQAPPPASLCREGSSRNRRRALHGVATIVLGLDQRAGTFDRLGTSGLPGRRVRTLLDSRI